MTRLTFLLFSHMVAFTILAQDYFPMDINNTWTFEKLDTNGAIIGSNYMEFENNYTVNNLDVFLAVDNITDSTGTTIIKHQLYNDTVNNNDIYIIIEGIHQKFWQHNYTEGDKWAWFHDDSVAVQYLGSVSVPAGDFNDCYLITMGNYLGYVFAPNVGMIKVIQNGKEKFILTEFNTLVTDISILPLNISADFVVYPNPTDGVVNFDLESKDLVTIDVLNKYGTVIEKTNIVDQRISIDLSDYVDGVYFVNAIGNNKSKVQTIVKSSDKF